MEHLYFIIGFLAGIPVGRVTTKVAWKLRCWVRNAQHS